MTAENKPTFRTAAVEFIKNLGLLAQLALDPRTDPLYVEWKRRRQSSPISRIRNAVNLDRVYSNWRIRSKQ